MTRREQWVANTKSDAKWFLVLVVCVLLYPYASKLPESRLYRDLVGLTPFSDVVVRTTLRDDGLHARGTMVKVRCEFQSLTGFVILENGQARRVFIDTSKEDERGPTGNRPASRVPQQWGDWVLRYNGRHGVPVAYEIYAHHDQCPSEPPSQVNLFAAGPWGDNLKGVKQ